MTEMDPERIAELEHDNRRLRRLLDQRDAPGELRHRLRSTLSLLRGVIQGSAETERDLLSYVAHLDDRLDAIARAQALADENGEVDLRTLLTDEMLKYGASESDKLILSGPDVQLRPRTGQIFALAVHELAVNSVEHGALGADSGRIELSWSVSVAKPEMPFLFLWVEHGPILSAKPVTRGFGIQVLTRMLQYELDADTQLTFDADGLHCTISFPLMDQAVRSSLR